MRFTAHPHTAPQVCSFCHDGLGGERSTCPLCRTAYHPACGREFGGCPTLGCEGLRRRHRRPERRSLGELSARLDAIEDLIADDPLRHVEARRNGRRARWIRAVTWAAALVLLTFSPGQGLLALVLFVVGLVGTPVEADVLTAPSHSSLREAAGLAEALGPDLDHTHDLAKILLIPCVLSVVVTLALSRAPDPSGWTVVFAAVTALTLRPVLDAESLRRRLTSLRQRLDQSPSSPRR